MQSDRSEAIKKYLNLELSESTIAHRQKQFEIKGFAHEVGVKM